MTLSCDCDYDYSDCDFWYEQPNDFVKFKGSKDTKCCSCNKLIEKNNTCLEFERYRNYDEELDDIDDEDEDGEYVDHSNHPVRIDNLFMCEACGEIYLNLTDIGYCVSIDDRMSVLMEEYKKMVTENAEETKTKTNRKII